MKNLFKKLSILSLIAATVLSVQSCYVDSPPPRGNATRDYALSGFERLEMGSAFSVVVRQGTAFSVRATGELNDLDDLEIYVEGGSGKLRAGYRNRVRNRRPMEISVTMPVLRKVDFSGASRSDIEGFETAESIEFDLSGASRSYFRGKAGKIEAELSGASELQLEGEGNRLEAELSGASDISGFAFPVSRADLDLSGASKARVNVSDRLKVKAGGASKVRYKGAPSVEQDLSGASSVTRE